MSYRVRGHCHPLGVLRHLCREWMSLLVLFGSETGTAEDVGESLWREGRARGLAPRLAAIDEFSIEDLPRESVVVFVVATTGQGEFPPNARTNWKALLRRSLPRDLLSQVHVAVIGLGDSSYQKYNFAGKKLFRRLLNLSARPLMEEDDRRDDSLCLADDQHEWGIDGAILPWRERLWPAIQRVLKIPNISVDVSKLAEPKFKLDYDVVEGGGAAEEGGPGRLIPVAVLSNQRVTASDHFQDTRLVSFDTSGQDELSYSPGDVLMVHGCNHSETVAIALEALAYSDDLLDKPFRARAVDSTVRPLPSDVIGSSPLTLRRCLLSLFDLQQRPRRSFFEIMSQIAVDEMEKEKLAELASAQGEEDYLEYVTRMRRTTAETLRDFSRSAALIPPHRHAPPPSPHPPCRLFDVLPRIRPRAFSIASSPSAHPGRIDILVAKVEYRTARMAEPRRGLCSTFISRMQPGERVLVRVREGTFRFPSECVRVVAVGPGTGVAPFRSLLSHRATISHSAPSMLFFGCRGRKRDWYFSEEWPEMQGIRVATAFSRDGEGEDGRRRYVQDVIKEEAEEVWRAISDNGCIFVAGSSGDMPKGVAAALDEIGKKEGAGEGLCAQLEKEGRLQYETWS